MDVINSTCVYIVKDNSWLMLYRNKKKHDLNQGKWIGVGGKCENHETFEECAVREVKEETGLTVCSLLYEGEVYFYQDSQCNEYIHVYRCEDFHGNIHESDEGKLAWWKEDEIMDLSLWQGDRIFLERMIKKTDIPFSLSLYYDSNNTLVKVEEEGKRLWENL